MKILVEDKHISIEINKRRGVRNINLRLDFDGEKVKITAPYYVSERQILHFVEEKKEWIEKHFAKHFHKRKSHKKPLLASGDKFWLQGQTYVLNVKRQTAKRTKVVLQAMEIEIYLNKDLSAAQSKVAIKKAMISFYKKMASFVVPERTEYFAAKYDFQYKNITIKTLKSRWGSCSREKNLNFNWRLIMAPTPVLDYVVVHEVCHLRQMNHSQKFWDLVEIHAPQHKTCKKWLREHGQLLEF